MNFDAVIYMSVVGAEAVDTDKLEEVRRDLNEYFSFEGEAVTVSVKYDTSEETDGSLP